MLDKEYLKDQELFGEGIGKRIREVRGEITQGEFASILGVSKSSISSYEKAKQIPSAWVAMLICENFHIEPRWLFRGEGEKFDNIYINSVHDELENQMKKESIENKLKELDLQIRKMQLEVEFLHLEYDRLNGEEYKYRMSEINKVKKVAP